MRDSIALTGITIGQDQLTSSLETNFIRNSADHPMYPTHGTRLTLNDEFTGGPLMGDINYHSHRYEGRIWLPSFSKHVTTMVRLRVGTVGQYPWLHGPVPDYARFRLGGGNTLDPLRGYQDYQVVPPKFISRDLGVLVERDPQRREHRRLADHAGTRASTIRRYPGGRYMELFTLEQQFPIVHPLHGVLFFDAGNVWDLGGRSSRSSSSAEPGFGFRMEIPILGNVGFDYGYGFNRDDGARWQGHFLLGNVGF